MRGIAVARIDDRLGLVELRLVGDVTNDARLRTCAEQGSLRALEHFDTLDIGRIGVEVAAGQLGGLLLEVDRDGREPSSRTGSQLVILGRRTAAHVYDAMPRTMVDHASA